MKLKEAEEFVLRAEQRLRDHDEFIPFGLFTFLSVSCYLAKYFKPGVFVAIFVEKNTVKIMWKIHGKFQNLPWTLL